METILTMTDKNMFSNTTYVDKTPCGKLFTTIIWEPNRKVKKLLAACGKSGTCAMAQLSVICELLTGIYKHCSLTDRKAIFVAASGHSCAGARTTTCSDIIMRRLLDIDIQMEINEY
jgi:hypothetical protein